MEEIFGKHFSITEPQSINTVIYKVNKTEKEFLDKSPKFTIERLRYSEEFVGNNKKKTFFLMDPAPEGNELVIFSFGKDRVVVNTAIMADDKISISKKPMPLKCDSIYSEEEKEIKDFRYTPNLKRPICIIDPETTEEVKPTLYFDEKTNEVKGKCKLKPYKSYFAFEIRDKKEN